MKICGSITLADANQKYDTQQLHPGKLHTLRTLPCIIIYNDVGGVERLFAVKLSDEDEWVLCDKNKTHLTEAEALKKAEVYTEHRKQHEKRSFTIKLELRRCHIDFTP